MSTKPEVTVNDDRSVVFNSGQRLVSVHPAGTCLGEACPIHNPSDHELRGYPLFFNGRHMVRVVGRELFVDPDDFYFRTEKQAILRNSATCLVCGDMIVSKARHHMATCSCGNASVDGGAFYLRRGGNPETVMDTSIVVYKEPDES